jgi:hypothetical protein
MVKTLTEQPSEAASQAAVKADHQERNRKAWNLPRASVRTAPRRRHRDGLDWDSFRDLYYPSTRRHDFAAIMAYGDYKRSPQADQPDADPSDAPSLAEWEAEGGTT